MTNVLPATGGADAADLTEALEEILFVHRRERAVTADDFQSLALRVPNVRRAETLPLLHPDHPTHRAAGVVSVMIFPDEDLARPNAPAPDVALLRRVAAYLNPRRLVTIELYVIPPTYRAVALSVGVRVRDGYQADAVARWVELILRTPAPLPPFGPDGAGGCSGAPGPPGGAGGRRRPGRGRGVPGGRAALGWPAPPPAPSSRSRGRSPSNSGGAGAGADHRGRGRRAAGAWRGLSADHLRHRAGRPGAGPAPPDVLMDGDCGLSRLAHPDQWARCRHVDTSLLDGGGVEPTWSGGSPPPAAPPADPCPTGPAGPGGLAFDRWEARLPVTPGPGLRRCWEIGSGADASVAAASSQPGILRVPRGLAVDGGQRLRRPRPAPGPSTWSTSGASACAVACWCGRDATPGAGRRTWPPAAAAPSWPCSTRSAWSGSRGAGDWGSRPAARPPAWRRPAPAPARGHRRRGGPGAVGLDRDRAAAVASAGGTVLAQVDGATDPDVTPDGVLVVAAGSGQLFRRFRAGIGGWSEIEPFGARGYDGAAIAVAPDGRVAFTAAGGGFA